MLTEQSNQTNNATLLTKRNIDFGGNFAVPLRTRLMCVLSPSKFAGVAARVFWGHTNSLQFAKWRLSNSPADPGPQWGVRGPLVTPAPPKYPSESVPQVDPSAHIFDPSRGANTGPCEQKESRVDLNVGVRLIHTRSQHFTGLSL